MSLKDLTGQKFGKWAVLYRAENKNGKVMWHCKCECGNEKDVRGDHLKAGMSLSCGCLQKEITRSRTEDLTNKQFNYLTVLYRNGSTNSGIAKWHCKCKCGNELDVDSVSLRKGHTKSCGCIKKITNQGKTLKDLSKQRFGKLYVLYRNGSNKFGNAIWHCKCDCGNETDVLSQNLLRGDTKSCGCLKSKGELTIKNILIQYNIIFEQEKTFPLLVSVKQAPLRFDFYLPDYNIAIEYQGQQHFYPIEQFGGIKQFQKQKENDKLKEDYCQNNNIKLIQIAYEDFNRIEEILRLEGIL